MEQWAGFLALSYTLLAATQRCHVALRLCQPMKPILQWLEACLTSSMTDWIGLTAQPLAAILETGLTVLQVGTRHGNLKVHAFEMHRAGHAFYCSENGVW
jgi:hypothetical protein